MVSRTSSSPGWPARPTGLVEAPGEVIPASVASRVRQVKDPGRARRADESGHATGAGDGVAYETSGTLALLGRRLGAVRGLGRLLVGRLGVTDGAVGTQVRELDQVARGVLDHRGL